MTPGRLLWSLSASGLGTTLAAAGNSGGWQAPGPPPWTPDAITPVDLRFTDDLWLTAFCSGTAGSSLTASLGIYDDLGNRFTVGTTTPAVSATGTGGSLSLGLHGGAASNFVVLPSWGQVAWSVTGTFSGCEIALFGR